MIEKAIEFSKKDYSDVDAISALGGGWIAEETLAIAIYSCLKYQNDFEKAVVFALSIMMATAIIQVLLLEILWVLILVFQKFQTIS